MTEPVVVEAWAEEFWPVEFHYGTETSRLRDLADYLDGHDGAYLVNATNSWSDFDEDFYLSAIVSFTAAL